MPHVNDPVVMRELLTTPARWAVVGLSTNRDRPAYNVSGYLKRVLGMTIVPVHPKADAVHGEQGYATLVDVVDLFVNATHAGAVVDQAIARGAKAVWLQLDIIDEAAAARATAAGLTVVMDACPAIEGPRLGLR
jgi:predicted CoA-binding protein